VCSFVTARVQSPYIQLATTDETTTHTMQAKKAAHTRRRKASPSAPRPGISNALNGSLKGACFCSLLSRVLHRIRARPFTAPQKKLMKPINRQARRSSQPCRQNPSEIVQIHVTHASNAFAKRQLYGKRRYASWLFRALSIVPALGDALVCLLANLASRANDQSRPPIHRPPVARY